MKIVDILKNQDYLQKIITQARIGRATSDCNAIGGALCETELCRIFNKKSKKYKLLNAKMLTTVKDYHKLDYGGFATDYEDLMKKAAGSFGSLSAGDFFLFEKTAKCLKLKDVASLKTSIPNSDDEQKSSNLFIHNDSSSLIYDLVKNKKITKRSNIGSIIFIVLREKVAKVYHFDGNLQRFFKNIEIKDHKIGGVTKSIHLFHKKFRKGKSRIGEMINRNATSKNKMTSFNRGFRITIPRVKSENIKYFDSFDLFVKEGVFKKISEVSNDQALVIANVLKQYSL